MVRMNNRGGFTYLTVMFAVFLIGLAAAMAGQQWKTLLKREREAELLFRGGEIQRAIWLYCQISRPGIQHCPGSLEDLLKDPGSAVGRRYLRKLYKDPITNGDWELVKSPDGRFVLGVHSKSDETPLKTADFPPAFKEFQGKAKYSEWVFECRAVRQPQLPPAESGQPQPALPRPTNC
jgi:type II secretory pathway pseudopilin PulG